MGTYDALSGAAATFPVITLVFTRNTLAYGSVNDASPTPTATVVATLKGTVYRRMQRTINTNEFANANETVEKSALALRLRYSDNPGLAFSDSDGSPIMKLGDLATQSGTIPITDITNVTGSVERVRVYPNGFQVDVRVGSEAPA